jgi:hypothetical protein
MKGVTSALDISSGQRDEIRLRFFREHGDMPDLASVGIRRDEDGAWYLDVGATGPLNVPAVFAGLEVRVTQTARAVNAVAPFDRAA